MILVIAAGLWLAALLALTLWPRVLSTTRREWQIDLAAFGGLGAATLGFFWRLILGNVWMPAGGGDLAGFIYPTYYFASEWWRRGVIPLWNPHLFAGQSFIGDIQSGIFYPLNLLTFFLSNPLTYRDLELLAVLHYLIAGIGMYALLRWGIFRAAGQQLSRAACLAGALAFEFSDLFITHFGNLNLIASAAWLPLVLLFFARALNLQTARGKSGIASGIFLALAFLAGHIQAFLFVLLALGLYALYRVFADRHNAVRVFVTLSVTIGIGLGLSALVLLPSIEVARASVRNTFTYENAAQYSLPPAELVGLVVPGFFGRGPQAAWGPWPRVEVGYLGIFPLILALFAVVLRRDSNTRFFALLALIGFVLALGGYAILHGWLYALVPGFGQLRAPARFIYLLDFGLAILAAIGFDALRYLKSARAFRVIVFPFARICLIIAVVSGSAALSILSLGQGQDPVLFARVANAANAIFFFILLLAFSVGLVLARRIKFFSDAVWSALALALIFFDLFSLGAYVDVGLGDPSAAYNRQDVIDFLQSDMGFYRIDSRTEVEGTWMPDTAARFGLYDVNGDNPIIRADWNHYWESLGGRDARAYDFLNIKYVVARRGTPLPEKFVSVFDSTSGIRVYENRNVLPRTWITYAGQTNSEGLTVAPSTDTAHTNSTHITGYGPNEIDLEVNASQSGYLVLSEVYDTGWYALIDGREERVLRANGLFRALAITPGAHNVRFIYLPLSFKLGAGISGLTLLGLIGAAIYERKRNSFRQ